MIQVALYRLDKDAVLLRRSGSVRMADGVHIRIRGSLDYFPPQGRLQLCHDHSDPIPTRALPSCRATCGRRSRGAATCDHAGGS